MDKKLTTEPKGGFREELNIISGFGGQIALSQIVQYLIVLTDIVMMARLGEVSFAAGLLINSFYVVIYVTSFGLLQGMLPIASRAAATEDSAVFSHTVRTGLQIAMVTSLVLAAIVFSFAAILKPLGYEAAFAHQAFDYALYILPGYVLSILLIGLRNILIALGQTQFFGVITIFAALLNAGLNAVFAFGVLGGPELGLAGIGLATTVVDLILLGVFGLLVRRAIRGRYVPDRRPLGTPFHIILQIGVPTALIFFIETSMFSGMLFIVGRSDTTFLVVLGLIFQYEAMAIMVPVGLSQAAVQRASVAAASGAGAARRVSTMTQASLLIVALYIIVLAIAQFGFQLNFPRLLIVGTPLDASLLAALDTTQGYAFAIIFFHAFVIVIAGILRGLEDVRSSLWIILVCYWGAGLGPGIALIEFGGYGAELSVTIVTGAMLLSFLSIMFKLNSVLRQLKIDQVKD
ncbi:MAG: MATE family efflux transporter [Hyphomicrobiales bacterium]|nr:MATE family efflux transporter [Hyphomicrobiales bacterium]